MRGDAGDGSASPLVVVSLLVLASVVGAGVGPAAAAVPAGHPQTEAQIVVTQELRLTPDQPGEIDVRWRFEVPDEVSEVRTRIPREADDVRTEGFAGTGGREYEWDGRTDGPELTFTVPANETGRVAGPEGADGRYLFVDTGEWALVRTHQAPVGFTYRRGTDVSITRRNTSAGPGAVGGAMAFLGAHETERRSAAGQTFRLVVPEAAELRESRADIFDSVTAAAETLRVGDRDGQVLMIAAPDTVAWGVEGLQSGERDFYVTADESVDTPQNVWLHEYVHTRQDFEPTSETRWLTEATAQYYAARLTLDQERIDYDQFRRQLDRGTDRRYDDVVLADPGTWGTAGNYDKGALVASELDRRIRLASDSSRTFQNVFRRMNERDGELTQATFLRWTGEAGDGSVEDIARRYTETTDRPTTWSSEAHQEAFGQLPASMRYGLPAAAEAFRVTGPYRNATLAGTPVLVTNETVSVDATATNVGGREGPYNLTLLKDGRVVDFGAGRLGAGESTTVPVSAVFRDPGPHTLSVNGDRRKVEIRQPAALSVSGLRTDRSTVGVGERVALTATVENAAGRPGETRLVVRRNDETVARRTVQLDAGDSTEVTVPVELPVAGSYTLSAGGQAAQVTAQTPTATSTVTATGDRPATASTTTAAGDGPAGASGPGFDAFAALAALVAGLSLLLGRLE